MLARCSHHRLLRDAHCPADDLGRSLVTWHDRPQGRCPACWPAYAGVLSALGLGFLLESAYLLPMVMGEGAFGNIEMGGMLTIVKVRDDITTYVDPGWYKHP